MVRVRIAPSPTGFLHVGNARTALYDELFARKQNGVLVLRVEDTDQARLVPGAVENVLRTLAWLGMHVDEGPYLANDGSVKERGAFGPYVQSQRLDVYKKYSDQLLAEDKAYHCFCTSEELEEMRQLQTAAKKPTMYDRRCRRLSEAQVKEKLTSGMMPVVRFKIPEEGITVCDDAIRGKVEFQNALLDDLVLMKSDGFPTYHLAAVVDDHLMEISHVMRGDEWLASTPKHVLLYQAFGWVPPVFVHLPLLLNPDRSKLSKRQGDVAVEDYRKQGYLPEALINFIALLGWHPSDDVEVLSKEELIQKFALERIQKSGAVFNREKLDWLNREYIKKMLPRELYARLAPFLSGEDMTGIPSDRIDRLLSLEQPRAVTLIELKDSVVNFARTPNEYDPALLIAKKSTAQIAENRLRELRVFFIEKSDFSDAKILEKDTIAFVSQQAWTNAESLWPLRVALSNRAASPSPFEMLWALGKEESLLRIDRALNALGA